MIKSIKTLIKKIIIILNFQKLVYYLFSIYASIFRYQIVIRDGIKYQLDLQESVDRGIFLLGWEPLTIKWLHDNLKSGDTIIEVGANIGAHSLIMSSIIGADGALHCFEPTDFAFKKLTTNFSLNPSLPINSTLYKSYVSNSENTKSNHKIRSSWIVNKSDEISEQMDENFDGEIIVLDIFFEDLNSLDFIKIDVDGFDFKVLQGAKKIIAKHKPTVFIELGEKDLNKNGDSVKDVITFFKELNYSGVLESGEAISTSEALIDTLEGLTHTNGIFKHNIL
jgi:FkbM family methyltransferase